MSGPTYEDRRVVLLRELPIEWHQGGRVISTSHENAGREVVLSVPDGWDGRASEVEFDVEGVGVVPVSTGTTADGWVFALRDLAKAMRPEWTPLGTWVLALLAERGEEQAAGPRTLSELARALSVTPTHLRAYLDGQRTLADDGAAKVTRRALAAALRVDVERLPA